jgi:hypothetical protein
METLNMTRASVAIAATALMFLPPLPAAAEILITKEEAGLPATPAIAMTTRGLTRGPGIEQLSPNPDRPVSSPLPLKIRFQIRNNVEIDPASIKLTYLKMKPIDLTDRIKKYVKPDGIEMNGAEVPPGVHSLRLDLQDKQGRVATAIIKLTVAGH